METEKALKEKELKEIEDATKKLKKAMEGVGENETAIIQIILAHTNNQRQLIKTRYQVLYKQYLTEDLKQNISGDFLEVVLALLQDTYTYEASFMNEAISEIGEDEKLIVQLLCTKDAKELKLLKSAYRRLYCRDLDSDILNNKDGDKNNLYYALASGQRQENHGYDIETVRKDAESLYKACQGKIDEKPFIKILSTVSFPQLYATFAVFAEKFNERLETIVIRHTSGNLMRTCLTMIKCVQNKPAYFAELLHEAMKGIGTDDKTLIRILVTRSEIDLQNIKIEYKMMYRKSLREAVRDETSGDYQKCLLTLIGKD